MSVSIVLQGRLPAAAARAARWLYVGEDAAWRLGAERGALAGVPAVEVGERIGRLASELRRPFLDWIGELGVQNDSPAWWASELAAKNPYRGLFTRLCSLAAGREVLAEGPVDGLLIVCSTPALRDELLRYARHLGIEVAGAGPFSGSARRAAPRLRRPVRAAGRRLLGIAAALAPAALLRQAARRHHGLSWHLDEAPEHRRRVIAVLGPRTPPPLGSVLLFTWADERSFDEDGTYQDPHVGPLAELLEGRGSSVVLVPRILPGGPFETTARRLAASGRAFLHPDAWISAAAVRSCVRTARRFRPRIDAAAAVGGVPVAALAREHVAQTRPAHVHALVYEPMVAELARAGARPERVILPYEGHAWETALTQAVHRHMPGVPVLGYENVNFSRLALSMYPAPVEFARRPLPDRLVTNGPTFAGILRREGFPAERVRTGCALRHAYLHERPPAGVRRPATPAHVVVASSIDEAQSIELIEDALAALGGDPRFELSIKCHPSVDQARVRAGVRGLAQCPNARLVQTQISELLAVSDAMLYTYSVVAYEALAHAVPPIFVRSRVFLDLDQLEPFAELRWTGRGPDQIRAAVLSALAMSDAERGRWAAAAAAAVREALAPIGPDCVEAFLD